MCVRLENDLIHWCLQSLHSPPLDLPGYVSGSEVSEEEDNAHCHDMGQVGQVRTSCLETANLHIRQCLKKPRHFHTLQKRDPLPVEACANVHKGLIFSSYCVIMQGYYSGYLLKRSTRDACLWRRRWCILGEDKVWYMKRKDQGRQVRGKHGIRERE
jgi:hypothetical protein